MLYSGCAKLCTSAFFYSEKVCGTTSRRERVVPVMKVAPVRCVCYLEGFYESKVAEIVFALFLLRMCRSEISRTPTFTG